MRGARGGGARWGWLIGAIGLGGLFVGWAVAESLEAGRLAHHTTHDDASYLKAAVQFLNRWEERGWDVWARYRAPHSPWSVGWATAAFAVAGRSETALYAVNAALMAAGIAGLVGWLTVGVTVWARLALLIFVLTAPLSFLAATEFRPDPACALATAGGVLLIMRRPLHRIGLRRSVWGGVLLGLALLIKPSAYPFTIAMGIAALGSGMLGDVGMWQWQGRRWLRNGSATAAAMALVAAPYYGLLGGAQEVMGYHSGTAAAASWLFIRVTGWDAIRYYWDGNAAQTVLGGHWWLIWVTVGLMAAWALWRGQGRAEATASMRWCLVVGASWFGPTVYPDKSPFFGQTYFWLLTLGVVAWVGSRVRAQAAVPYAGAAAAALLALGGVMMARPSHLIGGSPRDWALRTDSDALSQIWVALKQSARTKDRVAVLSEGWLTATTLHYYSTRDRMRLAFFNPVISSNTARIYEGLGRSRFWVVPLNREAVRIDRFPLSGHWEEVQAWIATNTSARPAGRFAAWDGSDVVLFENTNVLGRGAAEPALQDGGDGD